LIPDVRRIIPLHGVAGAQMVSTAVVAPLLLVHSGARGLAEAIPARAGQSMLRTIAPECVGEHHGGGGARISDAYLSPVGGVRTDGSLLLSRGRSMSSGFPAIGPLPFEIALSCPVARGPFSGSSVTCSHDFVRLSVAVVLVGTGGVGGSCCVLLTRRTPKMRTFPRAWVCPGGAVDPGEDPREAAAREVREEVGVGVVPSSLEPLCLWESVYPTTREACLSDGRIRGHSLVLFYKAELDMATATSQLRLQVEETDAAVWMPTRHLWAFSLQVAQRSSDGRLVRGGDVNIRLAGMVLGSEDVKDLRRHVRLSDLAQLYPSGDGNLSGCGEAHMFALRELALLPGVMPTGENGAGLVACTHEGDDVGRSRL